MMPEFTPYFYEQMGKTEAQVANDVWALGELVQANHGKWTRAHLIEQAGDLAYLLDQSMLIKDILFENDEGVIWAIRHLKFHDLNKSERKLVGEMGDLAHIWAGGKGDRWRWVRTWIARFGGSLDAEIGERYNALLAEWRAFYMPPERPIPVRKEGTEWMARLSTKEVAHYWAVACLMDTWMWSLTMNVMGSGGIYAWMRAVWSEQARMFQSELEYRTEADPPPQSSKKKTEAAFRDYRSASLELVGGWRNFFTDDFMAMVKETAFPFHISDLDYEQLPEAAPENKPIKWMSDGELVRDFMRFLDADFDRDSFEYEDRELLLDNLRKQYARILGQKVEVES